jgi:ribose transport system permease protein
MLAIAVLVRLLQVLLTSVGATIDISCVIATAMQTGQHWGMWPAIGLAIAASIAIGVINGFIVVKLGGSSFIATLGMATIIGAVQSIVSGQVQPLPPRRLCGTTWLAIRSSVSRLYFST